MPDASHTLLHTVPFSQCPLTPWLDMFCHSHQPQDGSSPPAASVPTLWVSHIHPSTTMSLTGHRLGLAEVITNVFLLPKALCSPLEDWVCFGLCFFSSILHNDIKPYLTALPLPCCPTSSLLQLFEVLSKEVYSETPGPKATNNLKDYCPCLGGAALCTSTPPFLQGHPVELISTHQETHITPQRGKQLS